ncbi:MAG: hypothetical protein OEX97_04040 [Acidimicrobiia bacterium]|nr:hypothetical protein [Acidimicrobiia bacterium]
MTDSGSADIQAATDGRPPSHPRIFGIPALSAPVVAVLRRGPSDWWHVGRWLLDRPEYEPGAWFKGSLYPQKCDLSPNGRWLAYAALREPSDWPAGSVFEAVSRLPWLSALSAWGAGTTYSRGIHFEDAPGLCEIGAPDVGDPGPCLAQYSIRINVPIQFAVERRRGWVETPDSPPRRAGGPWDEDRNVTMIKGMPGGQSGSELIVTGSFAAFRTSPEWHEPAVYHLKSNDELAELAGVQWADWSADGRLLIATTTGTLEMHHVEGTHHEALWSHDLAGMTPNPQPAPRWASEW